MLSKKLGEYNMTIYEHSINIGFDRDDAIKVQKRMLGLAREYKNRELAVSSFESSYSNHVHVTFPETLFDQFLRTVKSHSFSPSKEEFRRAFGLFPKSAEKKYRKGIWSLEEFEEYQVAREKYILNTRSDRECRTLMALRLGQYYSILDRREISSKSIKPDPTFKLPRPRIISTPMGGQPGYRRR
jgi:hypothetical protein